MTANFEMISYPWSIVLALVYVYALVLIFSLSQTHPKLKCLYSGKACMITIAAALIMIVMFGFSGFHRTWLYFVIMLAMLSSMGLALIDDLRHIRQRKLAMTIAHLSVFIILLAGLFGSGDKRSANMDAYLEQPVSEAVDEEGQIVHLPFMMTLESFTIDQYPPQVMLSGSEAKEGIDVSMTGVVSILGDWQITVLESFDMAVPSAEGFCEFNHTGAEPAAFLRAENLASSQSVEGWVSCGSFMFNPASLSLPDGQELYMPRPMPKKYESKVEILDVKGRKYKCDIAVNHPARIGKWKIYQADYDSSRGRWSTLSVLQCVYDPWFPIIRIGLWMVLASALLMFVTAGAGTKTGKK